MQVKKYKEQAPFDNTEYSCYFLLPGRRKAQLNRGGFYTLGTCLKVRMSLIWVHLQASFKKCFSFCFAFLLECLDDLIKCLPANSCLGVSRSHHWLCIIDSAPWCTTALCINNELGHLGVLKGLCEGKGSSCRPVCSLPHPPDVLAVWTTVTYIPLERVLCLAWAFPPIQWVVLAAQCMCT